MTGALSGLRVLETASGVAGPYAGRLLAMLGADVVKIEPPGGDPARTKRVDDEPIAGVSPLYLHLNVGKRNRSDLDPAAARDWAHVVIDDRVRPDLDPAHLTEGPKLVSVTPWGIDGPRAGRIDDELIVQAQSGFIGFNRDPDDSPLRLPGWPSQYMAGSLAAVAALSLLRSDAHHMEVSWLAAFLGSTELAYADALHCERPRQPVGAHPPTSFPSGAIPCADGFVAPGSIRAVDWEMQCLFYGRPELIEDREYTSRQRRAAHVDELWEIIRPWYGERTKAEVFQYALDTPWAVGMVMTPLDAVDDPHLTEREFLAPVETEHGPVRAVGTVWRSEPVAPSGLRVEATGASDGNALDQTGPITDLTRLDGLRLIEMTVAWAGPYIGNLLAPLGVDVVKLEAQAPFDGWRALRPYDHGMRNGQEEMVGDNRFFEASGLYNALNRGKRGCILSLASEEGRRVFLDMVANADGIVANFSAHVLPSLGLDWETLRSANPGLVVVRLPAFGIDGPYSGAAGYGSIIEAMGGIGHRQGYEREGARISNIFYPDPVAGVHAAAALLAGLHRRDVTGEGSEIDLSHQEATWSLHGDALILADREGRNVGRTGNREPGAACSGVFATTDDRWVAVVGPVGVADALGIASSGCASDSDAGGARGNGSGPPSLTMTALAAIDAASAAGGLAVEVLDPWTAAGTEPVASMLEEVDHPITGPVRHVAGPFRVDGVRPASTGPAPLFDQHTDEVVAELAGYGAARIAELRRSEVIGGELPPPATLGLRFDV